MNDSHSSCLVDMHTSYPTWLLQLLGEVLISFSEHLFNPPRKDYYCLNPSGQVVFFSISGTFSSVTVMFGPTFGHGQLNVCMIA